MYFISFYMGLYNSRLISIFMQYLLFSFTSKLPWTSCSATKSFASDLQVCVDTKKAFERSGTTELKTVLIASYLTPNGHVGRKSLTNDGNQCQRGAGQNYKIYKNISNTFICIQITLLSVLYIKLIVTFKSVVQYSIITC